MSKPLGFIHSGNIEIPHASFQNNVSESVRESTNCSFRVTYPAENIASRSHLLKSIHKYPYVPPCARLLSNNTSSGSAAALPSLRSRRTPKGNNCTALIRA